MTVQAYGYHKKETPAPPIERAVAAFRQQIAIGNRLLGRRMRYCGSCAVGVALMTRKEYAAKHIWRDGICPKCGEIIHKGKG